MELVTTKWDGSPHYRGAVRHLGDDEHGSWLWRPQGSPIYKAGEPPFPAEHPSLSLVVPEAWWTPSWWFGHPTLGVYVNINTPVEREGDSWFSVDLDLDVIQWSDGRVEVVDRAEFVANRARFAYPPEVVAAAELGTEQVFTLVTGGGRPWDGKAARAWREHAERNDP